MLKKIIAICFGLTMIAAVCFIVIFYDTNRLAPDNPAGKNIFYTKVMDPGTKGNGERYVYEVVAYNSKGDNRKLEFTASGQLQDGAFLELYHTRLRGVTYWQEVSFETLPEKVQQQYN